MKNLTLLPLLATALFAVGCSSESDLGTTLKEPPPNTTETSIKAIQDNKYMPQSAKDNAIAQIRARAGGEGGVKGEAPKPTK